MGLLKILASASLNALEDILLFLYRELLVLSVELNFVVLNILVQ